MSNQTVTEAIEIVASGGDLTSERAELVLSEIMNGDVGEVQTAAFLIALRTKGETVDELVGLARTMRSFAERVDSNGKELLDTAGTGGGGTPTFNVSTTAAFVAAGAGCVVAKHGNRSVSSRSGSADLLEALGLPIPLDEIAAAACLQATGFTFLFAPHYHPAMKEVAPVRRALGVRTVFNLLGPLTNPAGAANQLVGVFDPAYLDLVAGALQRLGCRRAMVVSGLDGMDEVSITGETRIVEVTPEGTRTMTVKPEDVGLERCDDASVAGGSPERNAEITHGVLRGDPGPARSLVVLNAGAALVVGGRAEDLPEGVTLAQQAIDSGAALDAMERFVQKTNALASED